jgi:hypothetical protein
MKFSSVLVSALALAGMALVYSCQKEYAFKSASDESSAVISISNKPVQIQHMLIGEFYGSWHLDVTARPYPYVYGTTEGHANFIGKAKAIYNSGYGGDIATFADVTAVPQLSNSLALMGYDTAALNHANVSFIMLDDHGNSIWATLGDGTYGDRNVLRRPFALHLTIVGGTGRFENASGSYILTGYYNQQDENDLSSKLNGVIRF